ncbi:hypothetical protein BJ878DRAFT_420801, partial [Calycina marina]
TYDATSKPGGVPLHTLYYRDHGRPSMEAKANGQIYLSPSEKKGLEKYLKLITDLGNSVRIKCLPALAFCVARQRSTNKATKPPGKNCPRGFQKRHPVLKPRRNNVYDRITHWFEVIAEVLQDPAVLAENVLIWTRLEACYTCLAPSKSLGAAVKRMMVTAIESIRANGRFHHPPKQVDHIPYPWMTLCLLRIWIY